MAQDRVKGLEASGFAVDPINGLESPLSTKRTLLKPIKKLSTRWPQGKSRRYLRAASSDGARLAQGLDGQFL